MPSSMDEASRSGPQTPGYETRDANTAGVLGFLAFLLLVLVLVMFGTLRLFRRYAAADQQPAPASSFADVRQIPSGPELEVNARADLLKIYAKQQQDLEAYSWEDRKTGTVRIPIERAMDLLLKKGLPVMPGAAEGERAIGNPAPKSLPGISGAANTARQTGTGGKN